MKNKKIFLILSISCILILFSIGFSFAEELEIQYPGADAPTTTKTLLPDYIRYIFNLSLMVAGLVAFASLVYGGFGYLTSSGNPSKMDDAKQQVVAAILGLIILLSSFLILSTINPQLVILKMPGIQADKGVILYTGDISTCNQEKASPMGKRGEAYEKLPKSSGTLWGLNDRVQSIYFYNGSDQLKVTLYTDEKYKGSAKVFPPNQQTSWNAGDCLSADNFSAESIKLEWTIPGIHLYAKTNYDAEKGERIYSSSRNTLSDFEDKTKSIEFVGTDLRAILHENENRKGNCWVYLDRNPDVYNTPDISGKDVGSPFGAVSSMTVFNHAKTTQCNVTLYTEPNFDDKDKGNFLMFMLTKSGRVVIYDKNYKAGDSSTWEETTYNTDKGYFKFNIKDDPEFNRFKNFNDKTKSIKIERGEGSCIAVLFEAGGGSNYYGKKCEVYKNSDADMSNNYSNTCIDVSNLLSCGSKCPCTSSLIILPTK